MSRTLNNAVINKLIKSTCEGRLTCTSNTPIDYDDATAVTTVYFTPYLGDSIGLYDGDIWDLHTFSETSISLSGFAANKNFDIFFYKNGTTDTLEAVEWTDDDNRATDIVYQDQIYVKDGDKTKRYVGTVRTTGTTGQTEDSEYTRFVWNYYNGVRKRCRCVDQTQHQYGTSTWRPWRNNTTVGITRVRFVIGIKKLVGCAANTHSAFQYNNAVFDSATNTAIATQHLSTHNGDSGGSNSSHSLRGFSVLTEGFHYLQGLELGFSGASQGYIQEINVITEF